MKKLARYVAGLDILIFGQIIDIWPDISRTKPNWLPGLTRYKDIWTSGQMFGGIPRVTRSIFYWTPGWVARLDIWRDSLFLVAAVPFL